MHIPLGKGNADAFAIESLFDLPSQIPVDAPINSCFHPGATENIDRRIREFTDVDGHGWINQAHVTIPIEVEDEVHKLHVKTEWLRHSRDGTLRADHAVLTASPFDEPTYVIETADLELIPLGPDVLVLGRWKGADGTCSPD